ncbi:MAG: arylsulfatase A [Planctomycetota bacterium]|jgi:arylsulfatase A
MIRSCFAARFTSLFTFIYLACAITSCCSFAQSSPPEKAAQTSLPNIVFILADDLGYGELGSYGQEKIKTPHLDQLAKQGLRFTQHYSGAPVCAPSRCVLLTGKKLSRASIRGNKEVQPEGQWPIAKDETTIAEILKARGYRTGAMGKWGLGPPRSEGAPEKQGFDFFYGYNCQRQAHNFFPPHLWLNGEKHLLNNPLFRPHQKVEGPEFDLEQFRGNEYAPELIANAALAFIRRNQKQPFFLYLPFVEPHLAMQPPEKWVNQYPADWDKKPYLGGRSYLPHPRPRAGYAAMISHLDDHVGRVVALIDELGLAENTLIVFTSDNGPTHDVGGVDTNFFASAGSLRGRKGSVYEGGLRVPTIARWSGKIKGGSTTDCISSFEDWLPTLSELGGAAKDKNAQGVSLVPTLLAKDGQVEHPYLSWEFYGYGGQQAVRMGQWKGVRQKLKKGGEAIRLFDLNSDIGEQKDVAADHPKIVKKMGAIMRKDRTVNPDFPIKMLDQESK